jgi:fumarylacetoacetase
VIAYGVFREGGRARVGARVEGGVLDLPAALGDDVFSAPSINPFMARGPEFWRETHARIRHLEGPVHDTAAVELLMPFEVADYVDFFSSLHHATNMGRILRPGSEPLFPNWRHLPVGYHGRSGTVVPSGTPIVRPCGQRRPPGAQDPTFGPSVRLDLELELGFVVGVPSELAEPVPVEGALDHVFGVVLINDWSARDLQAWEYRPLGPFLGKSFATSVSNWVVPLTELEDRRVPSPPQDPEPLPYLREESWAYDIPLEIELNGALVARTSSRHMYWSIAQKVAHLTVNGAAMRTGDLLASGTISGPERESRGSLIELSWNGEEPIELPGGTTRSFLEDGDDVVLRGEGLGELRGRIEPARC